MFYHKKSDSYINENVPFVIDDVQYPPNWLNLSTQQEKLNVGLVEVVCTNTPKNSNFYWVNEKIDAGKIFYENVPKDLVEVKEYVTSQVTDSVYSMLQSTDYLTIRALETGKPAPQQIIDWRKEVRSAAANAVFAIAESTTIEQVEKLAIVKWPTHPNTRPF